MKRVFRNFKLFDLEEINIQNIFLKIKSGNKLLSKINIFLSSESEKSFIDTSIFFKNKIRQIFKNKNILVCIIPQFPAEKCIALIEAEYLISKSDISLNLFSKFDNLIDIQEVDTKNYQEINTCINPESYSKINKFSFYELLEKSLSIHLELKKYQILRIWNFIEGITRKNIVNENLEQNYQEFNNTRFKLYSKYSLTKFPASTGIGMDWMKLLTVCTSVPKQIDRTFFLTNDKQTEAFDYDNKVLVGQENNKYPPLFSRGLIYDDSENYQLFVSGTSSIIGQESVNTDKVEIAAISTIENILEVCNIKKISKVLGKEISQEMIKFIFARIYIKKIYSKQYEKIKELMENYFPDIIASYVIADICREELPIEIELYAEIEKNNS